MDSNNRDIFFIWWFITRWCCWCDDTSVYSGKDASFIRTMRWHLLGLLSIEIIPETFSNYKAVSPILGIVISILLMSLFDHHYHHSIIHTKKPTSMANFFYFYLLPFLFIMYRADLPLGLPLSIITSLLFLFYLQL